MDNPARQGHTSPGYASTHCTAHLESLGDMQSSQVPATGPMAANQSKNSIKNQPSTEEQRESKKQREVINHIALVRRRVVPIQANAKNASESKRVTRKEEGKKGRPRPDASP